MSYEMHLGRSEARNADVSTIKAGVYSWPAEIEWDPPAPLVRTAGGHKHPVCSKLLSPPNFTEREMRYAYQYTCRCDTDHPICREVQTGKIILMSDDLPRFLWAGCVRQVGRGQTFTGFLRGELLIAVSTVMLHLCARLQLTSTLFRDIVPYISVLGPRRAMPGQHVGAMPLYMILPL